MEVDAERRRKLEVEETIDEARRNNDKNTAKAIKYKLKAEETKAMFRKIKICRRQTTSGLSSIKVPSENSEEYITIDTPAEIEEKLLERNQQHFGQAKGTFPTAPPFSKRIDWGSTHTAELIFEC